MDDQRPPMVSSQPILVLTHAPPIDCDVGIVGSIRGIWISLQVGGVEEDLMVTDITPEKHDSEKDVEELHAY